MLKRIKNNLVFLVLVATCCSGCSALSVKAPDPLLKTCNAHFDSKLVSEFKNDKVSGVPSITFIYKEVVPAEVSKEIACLVIETNKQMADKPVVIINFFNDRTKALVNLVLDRENQAFIILEIVQASPAPEGQVIGSMTVLVPLDGMLERLAGNDKAFVFPIKQGQGFLPLEAYKKMLSDLTGGGVTF